MKPWYRALGALCVLALVGCSKPPAVLGTQPPDVGVYTVTAANTALSVDLVSEIRALREVELRPRVSGMVTEISFKPGQRVREGDLLFRIDPRAYDESVINARANLAEAEANLGRVRQDVARYQPLLADNAVPRQMYDQAVSQEKQYRAIVEARRAGLAKAQLERSYAEVRSPITGQIGLQRIEVGGLASAGQTVLAVVSTLDPVAVYFNIAETEYLAFAERLQKAGQGEGTADRPIRLVLPNGALYESPGSFDFADRALNPATGTLALRAIFPNPAQLLRPGMNARVRVVYDQADNALLVPQRAVTELLGKYFVSVVGKDNVIEQRPVQPGPRVGERWLIQSGLEAGERIVVEGLQSVRPGMVVQPRAATN